MGNDDKQDNDPHAGITDAPTYAQRLQAVADIVARAQNRFNQVGKDPGPVQDPAVIAALQSIITNANTLSAAANTMLPVGTPGKAP